MKKKQVEKEQNNEKQLPRQETTLGEDIFQLLLKKEMEQQKKLTFTNNQAAFTLKKDESVDISCLPTGWTYTVTETAPGTNFEVSYSINGGSKTVGEAASFTMAATGTEDIQFYKYINRGTARNRKKYSE